MTFDPTKPVQTRDGRPARILATDLEGPVPVAAAVQAPFSTREYVDNFYADGRMNRASGVECAGDLVNVPPAPTTLFFNVYDSTYSQPTVRVSCSEGYADVAGADAQHGRDCSTRIGLLALTFVEGSVIGAEIVTA